MYKNPYYFKSVTLLITHYNRSTSIEKLLLSFLDLNCSFEDVIVSDDGSRVDQLNRLRELQDIYNFKLITTVKNQGLGNNINKGQKAVSTPFTLYIQEDFTASEKFPFHFQKALKFMVDDPSLDLISLYAYSRFPYTRPYKDGFSEKIFHFAPWYTNNLKFYLYGDHPHLRRSTFMSKFGKYSEVLNSDLTEMNMSLSFIANNGRCLIYDDHYTLLTQENTEQEPSTATFRKSWKLSNNTLTKVARWLYGRYKFLKLNFWLIRTLFWKRVSRHKPV